CAELDRGARTLVCLVRRHPDVDDCDVWLVSAHGGLQLGRVPRLRRDLEAAVRQHASEPLAQEHRVLGDHDSHGISPRTSVPEPGTLSMTSRPPRASTRSDSPRRPEPFLCSARPLPSSLTSMTSSASSRLAAMPALDAWACFTTLVSASHATKYAVASISGENRSGVASTDTGSGARAASASSACARPPCVRIPGWMPWARERSS